jgi:hypothetical protein
MPKFPDANVIKAGPKFFRVVPGVTRVWRDAGFDPENLTDWLVEFQFPPGTVLPDPSRKDGEATLQTLFSPEVAQVLLVSHWAPPGRSIHVAFAPGAPRVFEYAAIVHTKDGPVPAVGDSAPKIIIEA